MTSGEYFFNKDFFARTFQLENKPFAAEIKRFNLYFLQINVATTFLKNLNLRGSKPLSLG